MRYLVGSDLFVVALGTLRVVPCVAVLVLASGCSSDSGLPTTFGGCASPPCEVALEAFTKSPDTTPHCPNTKDSVDLSCPTTGIPLLLVGTCGDYWVMHDVYSIFTGDFYQCIYDANGGELVGAKWSPDNHPTHFAGVQLPASCSLSNACEGPVLDVCIALGDYDTIALMEAECQLAAEDAGFPSSCFRGAIPLEPAPVCRPGEIAWLCFGHHLPRTGC
jgi:hypothetical protein